MAYDYEYNFQRNLNADGLHEDPPTFDLGHDGESRPELGLKSLNERISEDVANFGGNAFIISYDGNVCHVKFTNPLTYAQEAALNQHVADQRVQVDWNLLSDIKLAKAKEIDARTTELIDGGFQYNGKTFSLSRQGQTNLDALFTNIIMAKVKEIETPGYFAGWEAATYPVTWNTLLDDDTEVINDSVEFEAFYTAAMTLVRSYLEGGTLLKAQVRAATTKAEVAAIVDNR